MKTIRTLSVLLLLAVGFETTQSMESIDPPHGGDQSSSVQQTSRAAAMPFHHIVERYKTAKTDEIWDLGELLPGVLLRALAQEAKELFKQPEMNRELLKDCLHKGIFAINLFRFCQGAPTPECFQLAQSFMRVPLPKKGHSKRNKEERDRTLVNMLTKNQISMLDNLCDKPVDLKVRHISLDSKMVLTSELIETFFKDHPLYRDILFVTNKVYTFLSVYAPKFQKSSDPAINLRTVGFFAFFGVPNMLNVCNHTGQQLIDRNPKEAVKWFLVAARAGHAQAMLNVGIHFSKENNTPMRDYWFKKAALAAQPVGMYYYATTLDKAGAFKEAEKWYRKALCEKSLTQYYLIECQNLLAQLLERTGKTQEAEAYFRKGFQLKDVVATAALGRILLIQGKLDGAESYLRAAMADGNINAIFNLGELLYMKGDSQGAEELLKSLQNDPEAMYDLGVIYHDRGDFVKAEEYLRLASQMGIHKATTNLAILFEENGGDPTEIEKLYRTAAKENDLLAMEKLGTFLWLRGEINEAEYWYRQGTLQGCPFAFRNLGVLLWNKNQYVEAEQAFKASANLGDGPAMISLAYINLKQNNIPQAQQWLRQAIEKGETTAYLILAEILEVKSPERDEMYRKAVEYGVENAEVFYANYLHLVQEKEAEHYASLFEANEEWEKDNLAPEVSKSKPSGASSSGTGPIEDIRNDNNAHQQSSSMAKPSKPTVQLNIYERIHAKYSKLKEASATIQLSKRSQLRKQRSYKDIFVTAHPDAARELEKNKDLLTIIKGFLTRLANGEQAAKFKKLKGFDDLFSMRITKGDRFVFRILKRDQNNNITSIQILSVSGRYEKTARINSTRQFICLPWSKEDGSMDEDSQ